MELQRVTNIVGIRGPDDGNTALARYGVSGGQAVERDAYIRVASAGNTFVADPDGSRSAAISLGLRKS